MGKATQTKGMLEVVCNACGKDMSIPTLAFYRKGDVRHAEFGGHCAGTFRTVDQRKPKSHKASRDRKPRADRRVNSSKEIAIVKSKC